MKIIFLALFLVACGIVLKFPKKDPHRDNPHYEDKNNKDDKDKDNKKPHRHTNSPTPGNSPVPSPVPTPTSSGTGVPSPIPSSIATPTAPTPTSNPGQYLKLECTSQLATFNPLTEFPTDVETSFNPDGSGGLILNISLLYGDESYEILCHITPITLE